MSRRSRDNSQMPDMQGSDLANDDILKVKLTEDYDGGSPNSKLHYKI